MKTWDINTAWFPVNVTSSAFASSLTSDCNLSCLHVLHLSEEDRWWCRCFGEACCSLCHSFVVPVCKLLSSPASTRQKKNSLIRLCYLCGLRGAGRMVLVSTESWFGRMESAKATNKSCTSHSGARPNSSVRLPLTCEAEDLCRVQSVGVSTTEQWSASLKQTAFASIEGGFLFLKVEA